ncbi:MAG: inorganic phosphate transporter [Olsenella sp.]|nr:inorganic phosphate transporter [Olsenella sp.]
MFSGLLFAVLAAAFVFEFINGFHDTANAIATTVYTRALPPRVAILMSATMNFIGALMSENVALTIAKGLVDVQLELHVILAALMGAIIWDLFTWWRAIPSSSSHALIGSLIGATIMFTGGTKDVIWSGVLNKVIIPIFTSPLIGLCLGYLFMRLVFEICANVQVHKANAFFHKAQIASSMFMAYSHGNNDAQKTMGIITIALASVGAYTGEGIPLWVKLFCAATMALGTSIGGQRIMKTVGSGVTKLEPVMGFVSETSSAIAIEVMTALGAPVSTTQVITTSIMGAGTAKGAKKVKWGIGYQMLTAWIVTLPATMLLGGCVAWLVGLIF